MTDHILHHLAQNAVIDAVDSIKSDPLRNPKEGKYDDFSNANEVNVREAQLSANDLVARIKAHLLESGFAYFDRCFLANTRNAGNHAVYQTARDTRSDDLDAALKKAWAVRRRDWQARTANAGYQVDTDDD